MSGEAIEHATGAAPRPRARNPDYELHHPKWHRRRIPIFWWLDRLSYFKFIVRELTAVFVFYAALLLLALAWLLARGPEAHDRFLAWLEHPAVLGFHAFVLLALLFHSVTWLNLAPKALVLHVRGRRLPDGAVLAAHYAAWAGVSMLLAWFLAGG